jgi:hypothetical protein
VDVEHSGEFSWRPVARRLAGDDRDDPLAAGRRLRLDIGKAELACCVRVPDEDHPGRRLQEVETHSTMTRSLLSMSDHLACLGVTRVVMEAMRLAQRRSAGSGRPW